MQPMIFDDLYQVTANEALHAITQAAQPHANQPGQFVSGTGDPDDETGMGAQSWALAAAHSIAFHAAEIGWDPDLDAADGHGLVCVLDRGAMYRFATADPRSGEQRARAAGRRLSVVREAS